MTLDQWLTKFDPAQASLSALVWILVIFSCVFIWRNVWPWFVNFYWPQQVKLRELLAQNHAQERMEQATIQATMRDALIELKVIAGQQMISLKNHEELIQKILAQQNSLFSYIDNARLQSEAEVRKMIKSPEAK